MNDEKIRAECRGGAEAYMTFKTTIDSLLLLDKGERVAWLNDRIDERRRIGEREGEEESAATGWTRAFRTQARINAMESLRALIGAGSR